MAMKLKATGVLVIHGTVDIECDDATDIAPVGGLTIQPFFTLIQQPGERLAAADIPTLKQLIAHRMLHAATEAHDQQLQQTTHMEVVEPTDPKPMTPDEMRAVLGVMPLSNVEPAPHPSCDHPGVLAGHRCLGCGELVR